MGGIWIDLVARSCAAADTRWVSRRALVAGVLGSGLGLLWPGPGSEPVTAAARKKRRRRCGPGKKRCGKRCVSVNRDRRHCGGCKRRCAPGEQCQGGQCRPPAPTDPCQLTLEAAGCVFDGAESRWQCPAKTSLAGADLSGCNLENAGLADTVLSGATLNGTNLSFSDLAGANLSDAVLVSANLVKADLNGATLINAEVRVAFLQSANLETANLTGASVHESNLTGVAWRNTTCPDGRNSDTETPATCCGHLLDAKPAAGCDLG